MKEFMPSKEALENPYVAGPALSEERGFFDREELMRWVESELRQPVSKVLVLRGQRRIGKTTMLKQLQRSLPRDQFLPVFFDLQAQGQEPIKSVLVDLAGEMADSAGMKPKGSRRQWLPKTEDNSRVFRREFLPSFLSRVSPARPVVLLDEFDVLEDASTANTLLQFFSKLTTEQPKLAFVIATGRDPADLSKDYSAIFKGALAQEVWLLPEADAHKLVRQAEVNHTLDFTEVAVNHILALTHNHPFLTQLLCHQIWQRAFDSRVEHQAEDALVPIVDVSDVDAAVEDALKTGELQLTWFWDGLSDAEKVYISALAQTSERKTSISEDEVLEVLSRHAGRFHTYQVDLAPQDLVKRNILERTGDRKYLFVIELIRRWVKYNQSLQTVIDELDRSNKPAERLFLLGQAFLESQQLSEARKEFSRALERRPDHLRAMLGLGETLAKLGEFEEAVNVLDRAHGIEPLIVQGALARALVNYAQDAYKKGDVERALDSSEKAIRLAPNEPEAKIIKSKIWNRRGDEAFDREDFESSLEAYRNAGNATKIQILLERQADAQEKLVITSQIKQAAKIHDISVGHCILDLAFSPDAVYLASAGENGTVIIWGPYTGTRMRELAGHSLKVNSVSYSQQGYLLASGSSDQSIRLWDGGIGTGLQTLYGHSDEITSVAFSGDGVLLASGSKDHKILLWDVATRKLLRSVDEHSGAISNVRFSPDGQLLASGSHDQTILLWAVPGLQRKRDFVGHNGTVNCVAFSPDGTVLASGGSDNRIVVWDIDTGQQKRVLEGHAGEVRCLAFSPDAKVLASGAQDGRVALWYLASGEEIVSLDAQADCILSVSFSGNGSLLAFSNSAGVLQIWKVKA
jgi:WD40 repeat protein